MPLVFGVIGIVLIVSGVRGTTGALSSTVAQDFTPNGGYLRWVIGIGLVGAVGYIDELKTISRMFMAIVLIGLIWSNKGVFSQLTQETATAPSPSTNLSGTLSSTPTGTTTTSIPVALPSLPTLTES